MHRTKPVMFQRRHFEFIAETIRNMPLNGSRDHHLIGHIFAAALAATNPQFDADRFIDACNGVVKRKTSKKVKPVVIKTPDFSLAEIKQAERLIDKMEG